MSHIPVGLAELFKIVQDWLGTVIFAPDGADEGRWGFRGAAFGGDSGHVVRVLGVDGAGAFDRQSGETLGLAG